MRVELHLYLELLIHLAGTFLYWFLARELWRRSRVLPGNVPLRALLVAIALWYGLTLVDEILDMLLGARPGLAALGIGIDLARAGAWLVSFPLLVHTLIVVLRQQDERARHGAWRLVPLPAYVALVVFLPAAIEFARGGEPLLAAASRRVFPQAALYAVILLAAASLLTWRLSRRTDDARLAGFLRLLLGVLAALVPLLALGALRDPWAPGAAGFDRWLRTLLLGALLLPGALFAYHVQRYNLLRLSLSHRTLRHFTAVLLLVVLVMLGGPALGLQDLAVFRRIVAWGLLVALFMGLAWQPLLDRAARRSTALRRFLGESMAPRDMELLMASLQDPDLDEATMLERTARALGRWLGAGAAFARRDDVADVAAFWEHYEASPSAPLVHRLDPPDSRLAVALDRRGLHAVFPLRVEGRLEALLLLEVSAVGGGYDRGELEAVQGLIRQLAGSLALRRLTASRLAEERLLAERAEHERLRMLGLVAASVAHEVKNPLSSMKALAQALRQDLAADDSHAYGVVDLDHILEQIDRLHCTVREILGLARPRAGATTDLAALVRSSLYVLSAEAKKRGVILVGDVVEEVGEVPGSEIAWQTVIFNLILNAIEHASTCERAEVRLEAEGDGITFTTANRVSPATGPPADEIFEPFVSEGGTGLGLALVKRRCEELGARLRMDVEARRVIFRVTAATEAGA